MTTDEALEELRRLNDANINVFALVPDRHLFIDGEQECWSIYDINSGSKWDRIIATGPTPAAAIAAAREKLEGK